MEEDDDEADGDVDDDGDDDHYDEVDSDNDKRLLYQNVDDNPLVNTYDRNGDDIDEDDDDDDDWDVFDDYYNADDDDNDDDNVEDSDGDGRRASERAPLDEEDDDCGFVTFPRRNFGDTFQDQIRVNKEHNETRSSSIKSEQHFEEKVKNKIRC